MEPKIVALIYRVQQDRKNVATSFFDDSVYGDCVLILLSVLRI